jgi:hypothetical protein
MMGENLLFSGDWALVDGCMDNSPRNSRKNSNASLSEAETELRRRSEVESVLRHETESEESSRCTSRGEQVRDVDGEEGCEGKCDWDGVREDGQRHVRWKGLHAS